MDRGSYWELRAEQRSQLWLRARRGRLTASNVAVAVGHSTKFSTPDELMEEMMGRKVKLVTPKQRENMDYGTQMEPVARQWYSKAYNVEVFEAGLCVPKWNKRLGASPDGLVEEDGCIEIKCVKEMYKPLYNQEVEPQDRIWPSHWDQMMTQMAVTGRSWCDYVVYCPNQNACYIENIPFDDEYWNQELYPAIEKFLQTLGNIPRMDPL